MSRCLLFITTGSPPPMKIHGKMTPGRNRHVLRNTEWAATRRGAAYLFRYREASLQKLVKAGVREQPWQ